MPKHLLSLLLLCLMIPLNLFWGSIHLPIEEIWKVITFSPEASETARIIVLESRLPSILTAILAGSALAVSGIIMQTVFANPLADPSVLGVSAGASLGAAIALLCCGSALTTAWFSLSGFLLTMSAAFIGAMLVIIILLACSVRLRNNLLLLITGVMISFVTSSLVSLLSFFSTEQGVHSYVIWGLGNFSGISWDRIPLLACFIIPSLLITFLLSKPLNSLLLGQDYATNLGFKITKIRTQLLLLTGVLTAAVTAFCGPISFIGLAVPHMARFWFRTSNHRTLLPASILWGANTALFCLFITHLPNNGTTLPLSGITPILGVPIVIYILFKRREQL